MGIGSARELSRDAAIEKVAQLQALRRAAIDPLAARREAVIAGEAVTTGTSTRSFRQAVVDYHAAHAKGWSEAHARTWLKEMEREVMPVLGDLDVDRIDAADMVRALAAGWTERHETASRCRGRVESVLDAERVHKRRSGENPARWKGCLQNLLAAPKAIKRQRGEQHHDAMPWKEVPAFVSQLPDSDAGRALAFLTLTAARTGEVRYAVWPEIDILARTWTIPPERMKAGKEHVVALSAAALAILEGIDRKGDFIFNIGRDDMAELVPDGATVHGMRTAFSSWAGDLGLARDVVEKCIAHATGSKTERAYRRGQEIEQKRKIMERWALYLDEKQSVIVALDGRRG
jgi:integrase